MDIYVMLVCTCLSNKKRKFYIEVEEKVEIFKILGSLLYFDSYYLPITNSNKIIIFRNSLLVNIYCNCISQFLDDCEMKRLFRLFLYKLYIVRYQIIEIKIKKYLYNFTKTSNFM